jgi:hypothetical protein
MISESARMSSAAEARFRIDTPNSRGRAVKVIALDRGAEAVVDSLAQGNWNGATFFRAGELTERPVKLAEEIDVADLVVMIATAGENLPDVAAIGNACSARRVTTTGLVLGAVDTPDAALSRTLAQLRPWTLMLVIANTTDYIGDMLRALRA